jgi:hypothetical protein
VYADKSRLGKTPHQQHLSISTGLKNKISANNTSAKQHFPNISTKQLQRKKSHCHTISHQNNNSSDNTSGKQHFNETRHISKTTCHQTTMQQKTQKRKTHRQTANSKKNTIHL